MHRMFRKYVVSMVVVPGLVVGVVFASIIAAPAASSAATRLHMTHAVLTSARPMDEGTVTAPDTSYSIGDANFAVPAGVLLTGATDTDSTATCCTANLDTQALDGTVTLDSNGDGGFSYTPNSGFQGTDSFTYTLSDSDGNVSPPVTVTMDVGDPANTRTSIVETDPPATGPGRNVTIVATVKQPSNSAPAPTGDVTFTYYTVGAANTGPQTGTVGSAPLENGEATITTNVLPAGGPQNGSITLNATYSGDPYNNASNGLIPYYVLSGCSLGAWPSTSEGYPSIVAGGPEGYYIGQSNGWYTLYVTHPTGGSRNVIFSGTVITGPSGYQYTDGLILDLSSTKDENYSDKVTLVGSNKLTFKLVNGGDLDGFTFYAGCGSELDFTLNIGHKGGVPAKRNQIFIGSGSTKSTTAGAADFTRN